MSVTEEWIDALRSNAYVQGSGMLRSLSNEYCVLGVLCDIVNDRAWKLEDSMGEADTDYVWRHAGKIHLPDGDIVMLLADEFKMSFLQAESFCKELMKANDSGERFSDIADWIELTFRG